MNRHPAEGARLILRAEEDLDLAAVVAYEHHIMLNGDGYPTFQFRRDCHEGSKLVHVCDVYDALRTHRPYTSRRGRSRRPCRTSRIEPARSSIRSWRVRSCG